jgi:hypothetical protein
MPNNPTNRTRLARALSKAAGIPYQKALSLVVEASTAGLLPARLDEAGMREALVVLLRQDGVDRARQTRTGPSHMHDTASCGLHGPDSMRHPERTA